jgi:iron complex transport system ATP-binding protein
MTQPGEAIAEAIGVSVSFGPVIALRDVSFRLRAATSVALIGANGSGKTTLLHLLAGLHRPDRGTLRFAGPQRVAYLLQTVGRSHWMPLTVREVLQMGAYGRRGLVGRLRPEDHHDIRAAAERLEVSHLEDRQFGQLSGGQRQRVRVAQALVQRPTLLLLDEPVTGLDLASQQRILDLVDEEVGRGTTVVLSTHNLDEARHCDHVLLLAGTVVDDGPPDQVLTPDRLRAAYGGRVLGDHHGHDHPLDLLLVDDHAHLHDRV